MLKTLLGLPPGKTLCLGQERLMLWKNQWSPSNWKAKTDIDINQLHSEGRSLANVPLLLLLNTYLDHRRFLIRFVVPPAVAVIFVMGVIE